MLVTSSELIKPFNSMLINDIKPIVCSLVFSFSVICPFVGTGHVYNDPVVLKSPHGNICQCHGLSCASIPSKENVFERWCLIVKVREKCRLTFHFQTLVAFKFSKPLCKIPSWRCNFHLHNLSNLFLHKSIRIFINQMQILKYRVTYSIWDNWTSPNSHVCLFIFELFNNRVDMVCQVIE